MWNAVPQTQVNKTLIIRKCSEFVWKLLIGSAKMESWSYAKRYYYSVNGKHSLGKA